MYMTLAVTVFGEAGEVLRTVLTLLVLGLVMAFSPSTFGIELDAIGHAPKVRRRVLVVAESLVSTKGPATMYLVVRTIGATQPELWLIEYGIFLAGLAAPYVLLALSVSRLPGVHRRLSAVQAAFARQDLRRPLAIFLGVVGLALLVWSVVRISAG
jgi:hypothetical protein